MRTGLLVASLTFTFAVAAAADTQAPQLQSVTVDTNNAKILILTFDEDLATPNAQELSDLRFVFAIQGLYWNGVPVRNVSPDVAVSGRTVRLILNLVAAPGRKLTVTYIASGSGAHLQDSSGNKVASFTTTVTRPIAGSVPPVLTAAYVAGTALTLIFDQELDAGSAPAGRRFYVTCRSATCGSISGTGTATLSGKKVTVTLASAVPAGESHYYAYYKKGDDPNPLRGASSGPKVEDILAGFFTRRFDATAPKLVEGSVAGTSVTLYYDKALDTDSKPATGDFTVTVETNARTVSSVSMSETAVTLTLGSAVSTGQAVTVTYQAGTNPIRDLGGTNAANLTNEGMTNRGSTDPGKPMLEATTPAVVDGRVLTLTYNQPFDPTNVPSRDAFTVLGPWWPVTGVAVRGREVELSLGQSVFPCTPAFAVSYAKPSANALRNVWGTQADGFTEQSVTNAQASECDSSWLQSTDVGSVILTARQPFATDVQPQREWFTVTASERSVTVTEAAFSPDDPRELRLALRRDIAPGETVTVSYTRPPLSRGLWDVEGNQLADVQDRAVVNESGPGENSPATGAPAIAGEARVGETLEASTDEIEDADGLSGAEFAFQWLSDDAEIAGATEASYTLAASDEGSVIKVRTTFTDDAGNEETLTSAATEAVALALRALTASLHDVPASHDGESEFSFGLEFSEALVRKLSSATLRGTFEATNATVTRTKRVVKGENRRWTVTVSPDSAADVTVTLPVPADCSAEEALCTPDGRPLSNAPSATVDGPAVSTQPLTASFHDVPASHDGESEFSFGLEFSEALVRKLSSATLRGTFEATNATVTRTKRVVKGENRRWTVTVSPDSAADVTVTLPVPADCSAEEALCTPDGRPLSNAPSATVDGPAVSTQPLTASFHDVPSEHGGPESEFNFELRFSEDFGGRLPYAKLRDEALTATNGRVLNAKRVAPNQNQRWTITVQPHSSEAVTVSLAATADCAAAGAICTPDGRPLSNPVSATVAGPPREPLTADFRRVPAEHDGTTFTFRVKFSEDVEVTPRVLREAAFEVTGGTVRRAPRFNGRDDLSEIHVEPSGYGTVTITLPATADCGAAGAICTSDGRPLSNANQATVIGPVGISVADARAKEGEGAVLAFAVTLSRAATAALTVAYATSDGSARAGEDYTAASGTLSFQAGESSATVEVAVLDDAHDEGEETLTLRLSNASGAHVVDGEATGTIENSDLMPAALLARFGRATAEQVVEHIEERMAAPRRRGFTARLAGRELQPGTERDFALGLVSSVAPTGTGLSGAAPMGGAAPAATGSHLAGAFGADTSGTGGRTDATGMMGRQPPADGAHGNGLFGALAPGGDLLSSSGFELNRASHGGMLSLWSRSSRSYFTGMEEALSLDGDVRTTMFGADWARGPLTVGLSVGHTRGLGGYAGASGGAMTTALTGFYPWVGYQVNDRVSVWAVTGYGKGALTLTPDGAGELETGMSMAMTAVGTRGDLLGSRATGGFGLAFKADALWVGATTELLDGPTGRLNASEAGATRMRTALEGSRGFTVGGGRLSLRPTVEVGLRRDGGDAETGAGLDLGGGLAVTDAAMGLSLDVRVRTLLVHQAEGFAERGLSVSFGWDPTPSSPFGLSARLAPSWGGSAMGGAEALWNGQMAYGPASPGTLESGAQLDAEVGYGLPVGARFVGTPRVGLRRSAYGREYRAGWGLGVLDTSQLHFDLRLEAQRREAPTQGGASNGLLARATVSW